MTIITVTSSYALPAQKNPVAYNLHQSFSPLDVNELTKDQKAKAALDVQATIDEVQKLLALDPTLPRLTKGEIKDLFEKATKDELEKSILSGDQAKQKHMKHLIQALPFHSDEIETLEQLARRAATTRAPLSQPEIPEDLKKLLQSYGLMDDSGKPIEIAPLPLSSLYINVDEEDKSLTPEEVKKSTFVNAKDYEAFKPIESKKNISSDMSTYLKQFGLVGGPDESKKRKPSTNSRGSSNSNVTLIDSSLLTPNFQSLLDNIGISTTKDKRGKKVNTKTSPSGSKTLSKSGDDYEKLEHLLETIKELEKLNATLTEKEINRLNLNNFNFSESLLKDGPDPINYQTKFNALKNEVKRQNPTEPTRVSLGLTGPLLESSLEATDDSPADTTDKTPETKATTEATTTTTESTTSEASSTEEAKKNSLEDEIEPVDDSDPLPPPRRSGFYMLFDWNSFLEVGEDPDKTIIRFDPKIGDASRFLPVNIP